MNLLAISTWASGNFHFPVHCWTATSPALGNASGQYWGCLKAGFESLGTYSLSLARSCEERGTDLYADGRLPTSRLVLAFVLFWEDGRGCITRQEEYIPGSTSCGSDSTSSPLRFMRR
jgi:hypothetical protein